MVLLWMRARRVPVGLQTGEAAPIFLLTLAFAAQIATFNWGTGLTHAGRATLILNAYPLFVLLRRKPLCVGGMRIELPSMGLVGSQFLLSMLDWVLAAAVL